MGIGEFTLSGAGFFNFRQRLDSYAIALYFLRKKGMR